jgi:hypothetical protein
MKQNPEYIEGPQASERFIGAMKRILSVPREEIQRREADYQKQSALNPNRRGPKPKRPASPDPASQPPA